MKLVDRISYVKDKVESALRQCDRSDSVTIVAATKTRNTEAILTCIKNGIVDIGENRVQEAEKKFNTIAPDIVYTKRMIGHLQTNKVNKALRTFNTIDSVDTLRVAKRLANKQNNKQKLSVLLEVNTSGDKTKFGFDPNNDQDLLECINLDELFVKGLMTIGPSSQDKQSTIKSFALLRKIKKTLNLQIDKEKKLTVLSLSLIHISEPTRPERIS